MRQHAPTGGAGMLRLRGGHNRHDDVACHMGGGVGVSQDGGPVHHKLRIITRLVNKLGNAPRRLAGRARDAATSPDRAAIGAMYGFVQAGLGS